MNNIFHVICLFFFGIANKLCAIFLAMNHFSFCLFSRNKSLISRAFRKLFLQMTFPKIGEIQNFASKYSQHLRQDFWPCMLEFKYSDFRSNCGHLSHVTTTPNCDLDLYLNLLLWHFAAVLGYFSCIFLNTEMGTQQ